MAKLMFLAKNFNGKKNQIVLNSTKPFSPPLKHNYFKLTPFTKIFKKKLEKKNKKKYNE